MRLRNGEHGYGAVTKLLHWTTVIAIAAQFWVGYLAIDDDITEVDCRAVAEATVGTAEADEASRERLEEQCEEEQDRLEDAADNPVATAWADLRSGTIARDGISGAEAHLLLGFAIITLAALRLIWRRATPLPPWDPRLTTTHQRIVHLTEIALLTLQLAVPLSGLLLIVGSDDLIAVHVTAHIAFFVALAAHLAMVVGKDLVPRMLPRLPITARR